MELITAGNGSVAGNTGAGSSSNSQRSCTPNSQANNINSRSNSPKSLNGRTTNGNTSPSPSQSTNRTKELETYDQALEYLKPLEDFALFKENFRAIVLSFVVSPVRLHKHLTLNSGMTGVSVKFVGAFKIPSVAGKYKIVGEKGTKVLGGVCATFAFAVQFALNN
ncbi:hypothetical protein EVAR_66569_1 [Eumeta japonica]|uniref:Uncharacterized protein n=1 Tax=Eumeta variegata TaxID=151549 RepID=A0A4C2A7U0_EUMVA|nr:hypothetical protein EVAR_66569_1 [Eumeta japonica]